MIGDQGNFRSGNTKELHIVAPPPKWVAHAMKMLGVEFVCAKDLVYCGGQYFFAGQREDGFWYAARLVVKSNLPDELVCGKPYRQILGHTVAGGKALYVGFPNDLKDNRPRVVWGAEESNPYEAVNHENLSLFDNAVPLYSAWKGDKIHVVCGRDEGKPYDEIVGQIAVFGARVVYRARLGKDVLLVCSKDESCPCDDISPPELGGKEIVAWGTRGRRLYRLVHKIAL